MSKTNYFKRDYLNHKNIYLKSSNKESVCGIKHPGGFAREQNNAKSDDPESMKDKIQMNETYK